jgi:hypothetical protein
MVRWDDRRGDWVIRALVISPPGRQDEGKDSRRTFGGIPSGWAR